MIVRIGLAADATAVHQPYFTDENNYILECRFGHPRDADALARQLSDMPGAVEHGSFVGMASVAPVGGGGTIELRR